MTLAWELAAVGVLILLNAFFVAAEYGLVTVRRTRMHELAQTGHRRAGLVLRITAQPPRFIAAMQLGVTLTSLGIGAVGEPALAHVFETWLASLVSVVLGFLVITFFHVVLGELVPKGATLQYSERVALAVSTPVRAFFLVGWPFVWVLQKATEKVLGLFGIEPPGANIEVYSEPELKMLVSSATQYGELEEGEQEMIYKVFDFADKDAADVMVPRPEVVAIAIDLPPEEALAVTLDSPYTRYPVYTGSLDEIVGILHVRDLFTALHDRGLADVKLEELVRPAYMVPETKGLAALLTEFRRVNQHMAIVVDEYGGMEGIVTLEDLLEEIVGEIEDEFDLPDESVERVDDETIRIDGTFPIDEFNGRFQADLPVEDFHTVAGYVFGRLGRVPEPGDEVDVDGACFHVDAVEGTRIDRLTVTFTPQEAAPADDGGGAADDPG
ncbi:MAG TPA: hemolysin family protein [Gaiellaceae bacterium]|nr:hemolysin family protein [Gaiellaceae bacterium]